MAPFLCHLANREARSLGFIPSPRYDEYLESGQVLIGLENNEPCGFLLHGAARPLLRIYQTAICYDARRIKHATAIVDELKRNAIAAGVERIRLHCADDLPANDFWRACGFTHVDNVKRKRWKGRILRRWELALPAEAERLQRAQAELERKGLTKLHSLLTKADKSLRTLRPFRDLERAG